MQLGKGLRHFSQVCSAAGTYVLRVKKSQKDLVKWQMVEVVCLFVMLRGVPPLSNLLTQWLMCDSKHDVCNTKSRLKFTGEHCSWWCWQWGWTIFNKSVAGRKTSQFKGKSGGKRTEWILFCSLCHISLGFLWLWLHLGFAHACLIQTHTSINTRKTACHVLKRHTQSLSSSLSSYFHRFSGSSVRLAPLPPLPAVLDSSGI